MQPNQRTKPAIITQAEKNKLAATVQRVQSIPRGHWQGASTYRPGLTLKLVGKLTSDLDYNGTATFKQWASSSPESSGTAEVEISDYDALTVYPWTIESGKKLTSGAKVFVDWIAGRWYVTGADQCPTSV